MREIIYREPGHGALEFTRLFIKGLTRDQAASVVSGLLSGNLIDESNHRVKRCDYCGYFWRDDSMRNTKKTCSDDCKRKIKTLQKRQQRADQELINPKTKKRTLMDDYIWWLEYPYWSNEYSMIKIGWKYEKPTGLSTMDYVESRRSVYGDGNRKKITSEIEF